MEAISKFYKTPFAPEVCEMLADKNFMPFEDSIDSHDNPLVIVIDRTDRRFWVTDTPNLEHSAELVSMLFREEIKPTTFNDLKQWAS